MVKGTAVLGAITLLLGIAPLEGAAIEPESGAATTATQGAAAPALDGTTLWVPLMAKMYGALSRGDLVNARRAWSGAEVAAVASLTWEALVEVGNATRRIGDAAGARGVTTPWARRSYLTAFFRAQRQGSLDGMLRSAEGFAVLGDRDLARKCLRGAEQLSRETRDSQALERVRSYERRIAAQLVEGGTPLTVNHHVSGIQEVAP